MAEQERIQQNANATSSKCVHKFKDLLKNRVSKMQTMQKSGCSAFVDCCYYAFLCCQVSQVYAYEDHLFLIFLTSLLINSFCLPTHQCETENVAFLHQKNKTKKTIRLFLPAGLCSRTPRGLWTRALASRLCTGRTAASCQTRTCSSCSPTSGSTLVHLLVLQTKQKKQNTTTFIHTLAFSRQAGEDGQTPGAPGQPGRDHRQCGPGRSQ